jgi:hypothetical protein
MRTTIDLPAPLLRSLKLRAALESTTLEQLVQALIERGLQSAPPAPKGREDRCALPSVATGHPLKLRKFGNPALSELADE